MSQPPPGSTFTIAWGAPNPAINNLQTAELYYNGSVYTMDVPTNATLSFTGPGSAEHPHWHFSGYASLAYSWETSATWGSFATFDLTNAAMEEHSLGYVNAPSKFTPTAKWNGLQIGALFAHKNFKATTVTMNGLQFGPETPGTSDQNSLAFYNSLAAALTQYAQKEYHPLMTVSLVGATSLGATLAAYEQTLKDQFSGIIAFE